MLKALPLYTSTTKTLGRAIRRIVSCYEPLMNLVNEADRRAIAIAEGEINCLPASGDDAELMQE